MNDLYFCVKKANWVTELPTAYYLDDLCNFLSAEADYEKREEFIKSFVKPLSKICQKKYQGIKDSPSDHIDEYFEIEIPRLMAFVGKDAFSWYIGEQNVVQFIDTANDFLTACAIAEKADTPIHIVDESYNYGQRTT